MEPVEWSITVRAAEWLGHAIAAARNKEEQRFARLIEHAGTVAAGFRAIDRECHRIFLPIVYGDVGTWPKEQRGRLADEIVRFAYEDRITPAIRISSSALVNLASQQSDREVSELALAIVKPIRDISPSILYGREIASVLDIVNLADNDIGHMLEYITEGLRAGTAVDIVSLQTAVHPFVATRAEVVMAINQYLPAATSISYAIRESDFRGPWPLRLYVEGVEELFGHLLALQNRVFPRLPTPAWVWQP